MCVDFRVPSTQQLQPPMPKPGEIWELNRFVRSPLEFSSQEQQKLYSDVAQRFLKGESPPRYVMIVKEPEVPVIPEEEWQVIFVMLLSVETTFLSNVDLLIPPTISGMEQELLAETWHILPMLTCNLLRPVGQRLSREIYDVLLNVGDHYHRLIDEAPSQQEIQAVGLISVDVSVQQREIEEFHRHEDAWSDVLRVPLAAYRTHLKAMNLTDAVLIQVTSCLGDLGSETA